MRVLAAGAPNLRSLDLSDNALGPAALSALGELLASGPQLEVLNLRCTRIAPGASAAHHRSGGVLVADGGGGSGTGEQAGWRDFCAGLHAATAAAAAAPGAPHGALRALDLGENRLFDRGLRSILAELRRHGGGAMVAQQPGAPSTLGLAWAPSLAQLRVAGNRLTAASVVELLGALQPPREAGGWQPGAAGVDGNASEDDSDDDDDDDDADRDAWGQAGLRIGAAEVEACVLDLRSNPLERSGGGTEVTGEDVEDGTRRHLDALRQRLQGWNSATELLATPVGQMLSQQVPDGFDCR